MIILYHCLWQWASAIRNVQRNKRRLAASGQQIVVSDSSMFSGAPGRCLFCKFSQKNEKVSIKSQASTYNPDILAVCFLAGQSTFHHCEAMETDGNCQKGNISWHYILSMCSLYCFTSWNEFLWMADPNKCLKATCERIAYNFPCKGKPCLRQEASTRQYQ